MPLYEYACTDCGHRFDVREAWDPESRTRTCPHCMQQTAERQLSTPGVFVLKGEGFYKQSKP